MKRFTDTDKWRDSWFAGLDSDTKLAVIYIYDACDNAGVFDPNLRLADFCIGKAIDWKGVREAMGDRLKVLPSGKWLLTGFVLFQFGNLSPDSKPHQSVMRLIQNHGIPEGYLKGIHTLKDKDKDKDKDKEQDQKGDLVGTRAQTMTLPPSLDTKEFRAAWDRWLIHWSQVFGRQKPMPMQTEDAQLRELEPLGSARAVAAINNSITKGNLSKPFEPFAGKKLNGHEPALREV